MALKKGSNKIKMGFQLWSANLLFAFIGVPQAQIFSCACSKRKCKWKGDIAWFFSSFSLGMYDMFMVR